MEKRNLWNRQELLLAINLYCKTPFGKLHQHNPDIVKLSQLLGRTPSALTWKLVNFASLDPSLQARGIKGAQNSSSLDKEIWNEFFDNWDKLAFESEVLLNNWEEKIEETRELKIEHEGYEVDRTIRSRVNQSFFRSTLLASYNSKCCVTGISNPDFLIASHIVPWSIDKNNRLNPRNGILINALHDKAFEHGYITISTDYKVLVSSELLKTGDKSSQELIGQYHEKELILPSRFLPDLDFLKYHNNEKFRN